MTMLVPQLATSTELTRVGSLVVDDDWIAEQKLDGHRIMLSGPGTASPAAITRNGTTYTRALPTAVQKWRVDQDLANTAPFVLDGELVGDTYWVFDFLLADGSLNGVPLSDRRVILEQFFAMFPVNPFRLVPQARTASEKEALMERAVTDRLEGLVFKRADSAYAFGHRHPAWLKAKFVATADVVVMDVRDDGKESAKLGIMRNGALFEIGRCSLIGKPAVSPGDVVEVRYLYVPDPAKPRLYQPPLLRKRTDKLPSECDGADLKYTNKRVLETL